MADRIDISAVARVVDQASGPLRAITSTLKGVGDVAKQAGSALARFATQGAFGGVAAQIKNVGSAFGQVGQSARALLSPLKTLWPILGLAGGFGIAGAISSVKDYVSEIRNLGRVSRRTGASTEMIEGLRLMTGEAEKAENIVNYLSKGIAKVAASKKPDPRLVRVLDAAGISMKDLRTGAITTDQVLLKLVGTFNKQTNVQSKTYAAQQLVGKGYKDFLDIASKTPEEIQRYVAEAAKRVKTDEEQVRIANEVAEAQRLLDTSVRGLKNSIIGALLPSITPLVSEMDQWIQKTFATEEGKKKLKETVDSIVAAVRDLWKGIETTVTQLGGWRNVMMLLGAYMSRNFIGSVVNLGIEIGKLGLSAISLNPLSLALAGIGGAAYLAYQNWDTVGPKFEAVFGKLSTAAKQAWEGIKSFAATSWQAILQGFKTGGLWGAITAAGVAAVTAIIQNWSKLVTWFQTSFPQTAAALRTTWETIKTQASAAWTAITGYATKTINDIIAGWQSGGLTGAMAAVGTAASTAWQAAWQGVWQLQTWIGQQLEQIDWPGIGARTGNAFVAMWKATVNFAEWLQTLDWGLTGQAVGRAIGNALAVGLKAAWGAIQWAATIDPGQLVFEIVKGLWKITDAAVQIAGNFVEGLINEMIRTLLSATGLDKVINTIIEGFRAKFPKIANFLLGPAGATAAIPPAVEAAAEKAADQVGKTVPIRTTTLPELPTAPAPALAAGTGPPGLLQQARETQVQLTGEIAQRIRVDMSPDLRAMLEENKAQINQLGVQVRSAVDLGLSMAPAAGAIG